MQLPFGDAEDLGQRTKTRREIFLDEMSRWFRGNDCLR